jgi:hypothetical protein
MLTNNSHVSGNEQEFGIPLNISESKNIIAVRIP